ncbi:hypothetical protein DXG03_008798 [Asterophora parasitica]|uniref:BTB domain-containing protein n=1 Tax=Asterophora parasitica TaxID=117018 RepID=A0A9P7GBJ2_9AGAR|nr:hypothetical protein DXG03_008798 [Asterophora parasitica]
MPADLNIPRENNQNPKRRDSKLFRDRDAELYILSVENTVFRIHLQRLEMAPKFPYRSPNYIQGNTYVIAYKVPEKAAVLELMFQFIYPWRQPALGNLDYEVLAELAEAVEKYEVYPAQQICHDMMMNTLPHHAFEILEYAVKHNYPELRDLAAPSALPTEYYTLWKEEHSDVDILVFALCSRFHQRIQVKCPLEKCPGKPVVKDRSKGVSLDGKYYFVGCSKWHWYERYEHIYFAIPPEVDEAEFVRLFGRRATRLSSQNL